MNDEPQLPAELLSEQYIIGSLIAHPQCTERVCRQLSQSDFVDAQLGAIFRCIAQQRAAGGISPEMIARELKTHPAFCTDFGSAGPAALMLELAQPEKCPTDYHVDAECNRIINARRKRQLLDIADGIRADATNCKTSESIIASLRCDVEDLAREARGEAPAFPITTAAELAVSEYPLDYIVDRLLVEGQFCIIGGPKKALKTTLAIVLAICIALGVPFLGQFPIRRRRNVLVCSCESGMATIKDISLRVCDSLGYSLADIDNLAFSPNVPKPHDLKSWGEFCAVLDDHRPDVLFLDALYRMLHGDGAENLFKMAVPLDLIDQQCRSLGITPIVCHHLKTGRLNQFEPADMDDLAYAGAAEFMRQGIMLSRREAYQPGTGEHRLWMGIAGSAGHNSLWALDAFEGIIDAPGGRTWSTEITKADDARDAAKQRQVDAKAAEIARQIEEDRTKVCRLMAKYPAGASKTFIRDHCGVSSRRWPATFSTMFEAGELVVCQVILGNKKTPQPGYKLNTSEVA